MKNSVVIFILLVCIAIVGRNLIIGLKKNDLKRKSNAAEVGITANQKNVESNALQETKGELENVDLTSKEFADALMKIQQNADSLNANLIKRKIELSESEFRMQLINSFSGAQADFEQWAEENESYFLKHKDIVTKLIQENMSPEKFDAKKMAKINVALIKAGRDHSPTPELIDIYLDLSKVKDANYESMTLKTTAFYNLAGAKIDRDDEKIELCMKYLSQLENSNRAKELGQIFLNLNPDFNPNLVASAVDRLSLNAHSQEDADPIKTGEVDSASNQIQDQNTERVPANENDLKETNDGHEIN